MNTHNMFSWRNKKNIRTFWFKKKVPYLEVCKYIKDSPNAYGKHRN